MWLSLKIQDKLKFGNDSVVGAGLKHAPTLLISVPKKIVHLAVQRNRLKRLIREAFRKAVGAGFKPAHTGKTYLFRVTEDPGDLGLKEVQEAMSQSL